MSTSELTRSETDRRLYALPGVGTLRRRGWTSRAASAEADGRRWEIARRGIWHPWVEAVDPAGATTGRFTTRGLSRGGTLWWMERELALRPASRWREHYALVDGERELAVIEARGWGRRPVKVTVDDPAALETGLLLFAVFVVQGLADDSAAASVVSSG